MRIIYYTIDDLSKPGCGTTHVTGLVESFVKQGIEIELFSSGINKELKDKVNFHKIPSIGPGFLKEPVKAFLSYFMVKKLVKNQKIDIMHVRHTFFDTPLSIAKRFGIPNIAEINGVAPIEFDEQGFHLKAAIVRISERLYLKKADILVSHSEETSRYYVKELNSIKKISTIGNGTNIDVFRPMNKAQCRKKIGINKKDKVLCYVGTFRPWQGLPDIIKSMKLILKKEPSVKLLVVGGGDNLKPTLSDLKELAKKEGLKEQIIFTGKVEHSKVVDYINAADICLSPQNNIRKDIGCSPLKIFEYLASGKPIITTKLCGLEKLIEKNKLGIAVEPNSAEAIAAGVLKLLKKDLNAIGKRARKYAEKNCSWDKPAKEIIKLYRKVVRNG